MGWFKVSSEDLTPLSDFVNKATVYPLIPAIVDQTIILRQSNRIKIPDAIIAATALVHNLTLLTRNTADFKQILGLRLSNPYDL